METDTQRQYICNECKLIYNNQDLAQQCEAYCKKFHACNLEITKHAIKGEKPKMHKNIIKLIEYPSEGILSKKISKTEKLEVSLFCMAKNTEISEHTSTKQGFVQVIEGNGTFNLQGEDIEMNPGTIIFMNENAVHSLKSNTNTSFILTLIK